MHTSLSHFLGKYSLSHTDTEDRNLACKMANSISTNTGIRLWMARTRAHNKLRRLFGDEFIQRNLIIAVDLDVGTLENEVLVDIVGKRVIVVDEDEV